MSIFTCCEREDGTKYFHPCSCPSASFTCESESISPSLCGWLTSTWVNGVATPRPTPPSKYRTITIERSGVTTERFVSTNCPDGVIRRTTSLAGSVSFSLDEFNCFGPTCSGSTSSTLTDYKVNGIDCTSSTKVPVTNTQTCASYWNARIPNYETWYNTSDWNCSSDLLCENPEEVTSPVTTSQKEVKSLSNEDTDQQAIARETPVEGTSCSSLWSVRSTGYSWTKRTSGYEIECANLINGLQYRVTPTIKRRTAVIGSYGAWEDVTVSSTSFTATATTETIDSDGDPIALDHIQGYEYEITGVNIEKTA